MAPDDVAGNRTAIASRAETRIPRIFGCRKLTAFLGVNPPPRPPPSRRYHRAVSEDPGLEVQLRQDDLPQVLRMFFSPQRVSPLLLCPGTDKTFSLSLSGSPPPTRHQLQKEEVWPHQPAPAQEEAEIDGFLLRSLAPWFIFFSYEAFEEVQFSCGRENHATHGCTFRL